jgi:CubicO group peptidase (beta-lactamase class C family)
VRHLLNQTSGLSSAAGWVPFTDFDGSPGAGERQARALATRRLTRPVGSASEDGNADDNLLGLVDEAASGERAYASIRRYNVDRARRRTWPRGPAKGSRRW